MSTDVLRTFPVSWVVAFSKPKQYLTFSQHKDQPIKRTSFCICVGVRCCTHMWNLERFVTSFLPPSWSVSTKGTVLQTASLALGLCQESGALLGLGLLWPFWPAPRPPLCSPNLIFTSHLWSSRAKPVGSASADGENLEISCFPLQL